MPPPKKKTGSRRDKPGSRPDTRGGSRPAGSRHAGSSQRSHTPRQGRPGPAMNFRVAFDALWTKLFSSPVHLDSALSQAPPGVKGALAPLSRLILQRPRSLAHYLRFNLRDEEPWGLDQDSLAYWPTARAMAARLLQAFERDKHFNDEGFPVEDDFPPNMIEDWKRDFGKKTCDELVQILGSPPPLALRASRLKGRDEVLSALNDSKELEIRARSSKVTPFGFTFDEYAPVLQTPMFKAGAYEIQDEGSQIMALFALWPEELLSLVRKVPGHCREWNREREIPKAPGTWTVVDACAGAGGKTLALADAMLGRGQVFAYDVSLKKLESLRQRGRRAGLTNIKAVAVPEGAENTVVDKFKESADRVLVDAPCSGWGVMRRNPDLKWRQEEGSLERLSILQARLLDAYSPLVKKGGILTYGVCTFRPSETTKQAEAFLSRHPDFENIGGGYFGPGPSDGFFFHAFRRKV